MGERQQSLGVPGPLVHLLVLLLVFLLPPVCSAQGDTSTSAELALNISVQHCNPSDSLRLGQKACLVCEDSEGPVNSTVAWTRNNMAVVGDEPVVCLIVSRADEGAVFGCSNGTRKGALTLSITIDPCEIARPPETKVECTRRTDVTLTCDVYSRPQLNPGHVQWWRGNNCETELPRGEARFSVSWRPDVSTLSIQRATDSDSMRYCCVVTPSVVNSSTASCRQTFLLAVDGESLPVSAIIAAFVVLGLTLLLMAYAHRDFFLKPLLQLSCCLNCALPEDDGAAGPS